MPALIALVEGTGQQYPDPNTQLAAAQSLARYGSLAASATDAIKRLRARWHLPAQQAICDEALAAISGR